MQDEVFSVNMVLEYVRSSWVCVWSREPYAAEPSQGQHHQTAMFRKTRKLSMTNLMTQLLFELIHTVVF